MLIRFSVAVMLMFGPVTGQLPDNSVQPQRTRGSEAPGIAIDKDCETQFHNALTNYSARVSGEERLTLSRDSVQVLDIQGSRNGGVSITGWDQPDILVNVCKIVGAADHETAQAILSQLAVSTEGGKVRALEPEKPTEKGYAWSVHFSVFVPHDLAIEASAENGGLALHSLTGSVKAKSHNGGIAISRSGAAGSTIDLYAQNGGISLANVAGKVTARTANGGISLVGGSGEVSLVSQNGGIVVRLPEGGWAGELLEARSENGGLVLRIPEGFSSGIEAETSIHSRLDCRLPECQKYRTDIEGGPKRVQLGGFAPVVHVSTRNGSLQLVPAN